MPTPDYTNTTRALAKHVSGDYYVVEYVATWDEQECRGTQITAAVGPLSLRDDLGWDAPPQIAEPLFDAIDNAANLSADDAEWLDIEEHAGRLTYPIGAR